MTHVSSTWPGGRGIWYVGIAATAWGTGGAVAAALYGLTGLDPVTVSWWRFLSGCLLLVLARRWANGRSRIKAGPTTTAATTGTGTTGTTTGTTRTTTGTTRTTDTTTTTDRAATTATTAGAGHRRRAIGSAAAWRTVLVTGVGLAVYQTAYYVAIDLAGLAVATVVTLGAGPVFIALGGHLTRIERLHRGAVLAVLTALVGLVLLTTNTDTATADHRIADHRIAGIGFALLSAAGYAVVTLLTRRGQPTIGRYDAALGGFAVGAVLLAPIVAFTGSRPTSLTVIEGVLFLYLAVVPTALAYALFFAGLAAVKATTASVVALVEPVTATLVAVALLGEVLTTRTAAGSAVLLAAVVALVATERRATERRTTERRTTERRATERRATERRTPKPARRS